MSATQGTLANILEQLQSMDDRFKAIETHLSDVNGQLEKSRTGLATISTHMGQQATIQKLAYLDQTKHNEFQQLTTNASLKDAGKPPTVVTPAAFVAKVESTLKDLTTINAQTTIVTSITEYAGNAITTAYDVSIAWAAQTEIGGWIVKQYTRAKTAISTLFAPVVVKEELRKTTQSALNTKGGNPATIQT
jgi:NADH dehydrogenase/NADH:ubiquinone oxidoreductase subunit G